MFSYHSETKDTAMLKLCPQSIEILLPCEPFRKTSSEIKGEVLYIGFEPKLDFSQ